MRALVQPASTAAIAGYAAIFGVEDRGGDRIAPGAFAASLAPGRRWPLLLEHRAERPLGWVTHAQEDARGLRIVAALDPAAAAALGHAPSGLSFGYRLRAASGSRPRTLLHLDLIEVSLTARPMQPLARLVASFRPAPFRSA